MMEASAILLSNAATTYNNKAMITDVAQHTLLTHCFTLIWKLGAETTIDQFTQTTDDQIMYGRSVAQHAVKWHLNALVYGLFLLHSLLSYTLSLCQPVGLCHDMY